MSPISGAIAADCRALSSGGNTVARITEQVVRLAGSSSYDVEHSWIALWGQLNDRHGLGADAS